MSRVAILLLALLVGVARPFIPTEPVTWAGSYQAAAHLFVGGLLGAWLITPRTYNARTDAAHLCLCIAVVLSCVELLCFFGKKLF